MYRRRSCGRKGNWEEKNEKENLEVENPFLHSTM